MLKQIIIDADLCIKLGGSGKYRYLLDLLPLIAENIYMHTCAFDEVMMPASACQQLRELVSNGSMKVVNETELTPQESAVYGMVFNSLAAVMINPQKPNKNKGEVSSLAYAKVKSIPVFVTDEVDLQPIIDIRLNTGVDDIHCLRIVDIVYMAHNGEINISRKIAKVLWVIAGKKKEIFDNELWPID